MDSVNRVILWGAGHYLSQVLDEINTSATRILCIIDSDANKKGIEIRGHVVAMPDEISLYEYDAIIITVKNYTELIEAALNIGISEEKIITYWGNRPLPENIFIPRAKRIEKLTAELKREIDKRDWLIDALPAEYSEQHRPIIKSASELLQRIVVERSSLCRFGDGEYEIIRGNDRPWFQKTNTTLAERLKAVLCSKNENVIIAIAQNYILSEYTDDAIENIRRYMFGNTRREIDSMLERGRVYYDAYVSRPYIMYKNKDYSHKLFELWKCLWKDRDVLVVEGNYSKIGIGNDLLGNAKRIRRIICPYMNCFDVYSDILGSILQNAEMESLILVSLGPTATVLCYDLAMRGFQAIDIGQLDTEYEWYIRRSKEREIIPGKMVAEVLLNGKGTMTADNGETDDIYKLQIIDKVGVV